MSSSKRGLAVPAVLYRVDEAAEALRLSRSQLYESCEVAKHRAAPSRACLSQSFGQESDGQGPGPAERCGAGRDPDRAAWTTVKVAASRASRRCADQDCPPPAAQLHRRVALDGRTNRGTPGAALGTRSSRHGVRVADHGDLAVARWTAERTDGRPNAWRQVVEVVQAARSAISEVLAASQAPLVLGGECTLAIALVAAVVGRYGEVGLLYVDGGQDLMIPADHPREPILDAMGVAHMLDLPGCVPELAGIGSRRPLLQPADVAFVGFVGDEEDVHGLVSAPRLPGTEVIANPVAAGRRALTALPIDISSCTSMSTLSMLSTCP
jgi:hypothetical protein